MRSQSANRQRQAAQSEQSLEKESIRDQETDEEHGAQVQADHLPRVREEVQRETSIALWVGSV